MIHATPPPIHSFDGSNNAAVCIVIPGVMPSQEFPVCSDATQWAESRCVLRVPNGDVVYANPTRDGTRLCIRQALKEYEWNAKYAKSHI